MHSLFRCLRLVIRARRIGLIEFHGPAMIEEATTTVVVPSRYAVKVDEYRNYVMTRDEPSGASSTGAATTVGGAA